MDGSDEVRGHSSVEITSLERAVAIPGDFN
jgi:hypothetical protein